MVHFKNNNGFTLVEVLISIALIGLIFSPLFISQEQLMKSVRTMSLRLNHMIEAATFMVKSRQEAVEEKQNEAIKKESAAKSFSGTMVYSQEPSKISQLKDIKDIYLEQVAVNWRDGNRARTTTFSSFLFKPKKEKKKA